MAAREPETVEQVRIDYKPAMRGGRWQQWRHATTREGAAVIVARERERMEREGVPVGAFRVMVRQVTMTPWRVAK